MPLNNAGIVDFHSPKGVIWRCAQPDTEAAWALRIMGVKHALKLNTNLEFSDDVEKKLFPNLILSPLDPFHPDKYTTLAAAKVLNDLLTSNEKVVVHCTHGVDRTGLVVGVYRLIYCPTWDLEKVNNERRLYGVSPIRSFVDEDIHELLEEIANETHQAA